MRRPCSGRASSVPSSVLLVLLVAASSTLGSASPALAHTSLVGSTPAPDAVVSSAPEVTLVFSEPVSARHVQVVVTGPDGAELADGPVQVSGSTVSRSLAALPASGGYRLAYRVLAEDGHPVTGEVPFRVDLPAAGAAGVGATPTTEPPPATVAAPQTAPQTSGTGGTTSIVPALLAGLAGVALVLVVGAVRAARRAEPGR